MNYCEDMQRSMYISNMKLDDNMLNSVSTRNTKNSIQEPE
jgi:hypothetical protein